VIVRAIAVACAAAIGACGSMPWDDAPAAPQLAGTKWIGVDEGGRLDPKSLPRMEFTMNGRMAGFSGCNNMSAIFTESRGIAKFGQVMATKRFCAGIEGEIETRVLDAVALSGVAQQKDGRLVVTGPGGTRYDFVPAPAN
jgi:heat shock protein HslJ